MLIALVYDLRKDYLAMGFGEEETAEFDSDATISSIAQAIEGLGHQVERAGNIYDLSKRLSSGLKKNQLPRKPWDLVFNISEGLSGRNRESQVPALLEAYGIPYTFSDPLTLSLSLDKEMAKKVVRAAGVPTPDSFVVESVKDLKKIPLQEYPLFVKPLSEGTGKGITPSSVVKNPKALKAQCKRLLDGYGQPVLVETFMPGREFTVGIIGTGDGARVVGALELQLLKGAEPGVYSYLNKELCEERVRYVLVKNKKILKELSVLALKAYRALGCRDAGRLDFRQDGAGHASFLEANPLAGLHPTHSDLPILCRQAGMPYPELIDAIIQSAAKRLPENKRAVS
ncbi:MAG: hypothetical protein M0018_09875 [Nitrospiraceae bacterium]|nr:hypothetical protein [Nitrospiraceae bacterium]